MASVDEYVSYSAPRARTGRKTSGALTGNQWRRGSDQSNRIYYIVALAALSWATVVGIGWIGWNLAAFVL